MKESSVRRETFVYRRWQSHHHHEHHPVWRIHHLVVEQLSRNILHRGLDLTHIALRCTCRLVCFAMACFDIFIQ